MTQIKEAYVSVDVAQRLRDKGFDNPIDTAYLCCEGKPWDGRFMRLSDEIKQGEWYDAEDTVRYGHLILCPTLQMAVAWLDEVHLLWITIYPKQLEECVVWVCDIYDEDCDVIASLTSSANEEPTPFIDNCIKYCLENLI